MRVPTRMKRRTIWAEARQLRKELKPLRTQEEVAKLLCNTRQSVEVIELRAFTKILRAFQPELTEQ